MDNRRYNQIIDSVRAKYNQTRSQFGVGESSLDSVCNAKDYYLVVDNKPAIDQALQRISGSIWNFDGAVDTKVYTVVDIPLEEVQATTIASMKRNVEIAMERPRVDVISLGYGVDGGRKDKDDFFSKWEIMLDEDVTTVKDVDNDYHPDQTKADVRAIVDAIVLNGESMLHWKWTKEEEILACTTPTEVLAVDIEI